MKKVLRLKSNEEIAKLVKLRNTVGNKYFIIYVKDSDTTKVAISVSKKIGNAVVRNYQKRVVREIVSKRFKYLKNKTILIVIKNACLEIDFNQKEKMLDNLLMKVKKWTN